MLIRYTHAGLCHSDVHVAHGDLEARLPMVLGHEGAGIIEEVGPGVTRVKAGDHVVCSFIPNCGVCRYCASGQQSICDMGATILEGYLPGERFPITGPRGQYGAMCMLGTFSQYGVIHQNSASRSTTTCRWTRPSWSAAAYPPAGARPSTRPRSRPATRSWSSASAASGSTQSRAPALAGAKNVIAIDPLENKREKAMELGATHAFATTEEAMETITNLTRGQMADSAILTPGLMTAEIVAGGLPRGRQGRHGRADRAEQADGADDRAARHDPDVVPQAD